MRRLLAGFLLAAALVVGGCSANLTSLEVWRGNARFARGEDALALLAYFRSLDKEAGGRWRSWIRYDIGSSYISVGERAAGMRTLLLALEEREDQDSRASRELEFRIHFNHALAAFEEGAYEEAARGFVRALEVRPHSWEAKVNLELALEGLSAPKAAQAPKQASSGHQGPSEESRRILKNMQREEVPAWVSAHEQGDFVSDW